MKTKSFPRPDWSPVPRDGCKDVMGKVLLVDQRNVVAMLKIAPHGNTDIHPAPYDIHVLCTEGSGFVTCGDETTALAAGESVLWPRDVPHNLYTKAESMTTIMVEHVHQLPPESLT